MSTRPRQRQAALHHRLPGWMKDEDMLRRILLLRRDGHSLESLFKLCGITKSEWARTRAAARHSKFPGDKVVAKAFCDRFDTLGARLSAGPVRALFTPESGKLLAKSIAKWRLDGPAPSEGDEPL